MGNRLLKATLPSLFLLVSFVAQSQQLAFPGAEGFGKYATGGRGGKVYEVTNLNDAGPGSFRDAFTSNIGYPLTVVFKVSGIIELQSQLKVSRSFITIAGQTAPGDGICLKGNSFILNGARVASQGGNHGNIIIRYLRSRPGSTLSTGVYGFDMENCHSVIVDHCSFSWANEECSALYDTKNTTVQWCISSEGLYDAGHSKGVRSYSGVWGGQNATYHHNLIAHCVSRTARFNGSRAHDTAAIIDYRNNVIYNWGSSSACYGGEVDIAGGVSQINLVNNYYKKGPASASTLRFGQASYTTVSPAPGIGQWYLSGNTMFGSATLTSNNASGLDLSKIPTANQSSVISTTEFPIAAPITTYTAQQAYDSVLAYAGARLPVRDAVDTRIVTEVTNGTASGTGTYGTGANGIINLPSGVGGWPTYNTYNVPVDTDHDGMPDTWEIANGLNISDSADGNIVGADGYTMLENYLNSITQNTALPAKLLSFNLLIQEASIAKLQWATANEIGTQQFLIERSEDGNVFYKAGEVAAKGTGNNNYVFVDSKSINSKAVYYRLRITDKDGSFVYSNIVSYKNDKKAALSVYPNPVANTLTITHEAATAKQRLQIVSIDGKRIMDIAIAENTVVTSADVSALKAGMYTVVLIKDGKSQTIGFVKN